MNRILKTACLAVSLALVGAIATPRQAEAANLTLKQPSPASRPMQLDITGALGWYGVGASLWYSIPVLPGGFANKLNDGFYVEFGGALTYYYLYYTLGFFALTPAAGVRYDLHLTDSWAVFLATKLGWRLPFKYFRYTHGFDLYQSAGAFYRIGDNLKVRLEVGWPFGAQAGISIDI